ncbi:MAG TPA: O-antigen ligase family protein [Rudaea sp.]|nr:O-antigen ligase family protein [Rudaea sp.]
MQGSSNLIAWQRLWPALLVLSVLALLPLGQAFEAPLVIAAGIGLFFAWRMRDTLSADPGVRLATVLFAAYWLAALISAPDAIAPGKTWSTVAVLLRFLPYVLFAVLLLRDSALWPQIECAVAGVVVLWLLDAWVQIFTGYSIAGAMEAERLSGIFGAGNLKLGPVLAVLSPFVLVAARDRYGGRGLVVAGVFMLMPILLAGSRAAWLMYALVVAAFLWQQTRSPLRFAAWGLAALIVVGLAAWSADHDSPAFASRVQRTLLMLRGTPAAVDEASAGRLRIWSTAGRMVAAHPVTGVGVRGFRYAYPRYAAAGDAFVDANGDEGAMHAHQIILEVLSETGAIGLLLWISGAVAAIRAWRRADADARRRAFAPGLALAVMCFPLNTHLAFYSAWWGSLFWWLLALYVAAISPPRVEYRRES